MVFILVLIQMTIIASLCVYLGIGYKFGMKNSSSSSDGAKDLTTSCFKYHILTYNKCVGSEKIVWGEDDYS